MLVSRFPVPPPHCPPRGGTAWPRSSPPLRPRPTRGILNPTNGTDELGALLRAWRGRLQPSDVGSPFGDHSTRTPGLRREEVAWLAGVSADYVKRIEQGRARPTADVVRALVPRTITPSVRRLLDRLDDTPVGVFDATWTRLDHNAPWAALTGDGTGDGTNAGEPAMNDNLVWRHFLGDGDRVHHPDLDAYRASLTADLRRVHSLHPTDPDLTTLVATLRAHSDTFATMWDTAAVGDHGGQRKTVVHPDVGAVELDCDVVDVNSGGGAGLHLVIFTAAPGSEAAGKLAVLTGGVTDTVMSSEPLPR